MWGKCPGFSPIPPTSEFPVGWKGTWEGGLGAGAETLHSSSGRGGWVMDLPWGKQAQDTHNPPEISLTKLGKIRMRRKDRLGMQKQPGHLGMPTPTATRGDMQGLCRLPDTADDTLWSREASQSPAEFYQQQTRPREMRQLAQGCTACSFGIRAHRRRVCIHRAAPETQCWVLKGVDQ